MINDNIVIDEEAQQNEEIPVDRNHPIEEDGENEHQRNDTWEIVGNIIGFRTILRNKYTVEGNLEPRKARVVALGSTQQPGIDLHDTLHRSLDLALSGS